MLWVNYGVTIPLVNNPRSTTIIGTIKCTHEIRITTINSSTNIFSRSYKLRYMSFVDFSKMLISKNIAVDFMYLPKYAISS